MFKKKKFKFGMHRIKHAAQKTGLPPGALVHIGEKKMEQSTIGLIQYDAQNFEETTIALEDLALPKDKKKISWFNIDGVSDLVTIQNTGNTFKLHSLVLEDIVNTNQRPKIEFYDDHVFIVIKMLSLDKKSTTVQSEQVSLILKENTVITFQERPGDVFEILRDRLRHKKGKIRTKGSDYLIYALLDAVIDHYFFLIEAIGEKIETCEEDIINNPTPQILETMHILRHEVIFLSRSIRPLQDMLRDLLKEESSIFKKQTLLYFRDIYDHSQQIVESIETYRDVTAHMLDIYMSGMSNKMNQIMKVLTITATIFIPLTFIVGIYGMNFENMPELKWQWGYPATWGLMLTVFFSSLFYFRKKDWL